MATRSFFSRWLLATLAGWILGVFAVVVIAAGGELVRLGALGNEVAVGMGMGLGVGFAQWLVARKWFGATSQWMLASALGMGAPFALPDVLGRSADDRWSLILAVLIGALLVSLWQRRILKLHSRDANLWVPACIGGWALAAALPAAFVVNGPHLSNIVVILLGGVVLGIVTGAVLVFMRPARLPAVPAGPVSV